MNIIQAAKTDLHAILQLQKICYYPSAVRYNSFDIQPMRQTLEEIEAEFKESLILKAERNGEIIGSIRAYEKNGTCYIGKVIVHPEAQNRGIGKSLMKRIEADFPDVKRYELYTGFRDEKNLSFYKKLGYIPFKEEILDENVRLVYLEKRNAG